MQEKMHANKLLTHKAVALNTPGFFSLALMFINEGNQNN